MATYSYGANAWVGIGEESTWGTAVARTVFWECISNGLKHDIQKGFSRVSRGLDATRSFTAREMGRGALSMELLFESQLKLFKHLMGDSTTSSIVTGAYRHEFVRTASLPTGLTVESEVDQQNFLFTGCKVQQAVIRVAPNEYPQIDADLVSYGCTVNSTPSSPADGSFSQKVIQPAFAVLTAGSAGSTDYSQYVMGVEITIGNSLDGERRRIGSTRVKEPTRSATRPDIQIRLDMEHNDVTAQWVTDFLAGTDQDLAIKFTSTTNITGSTPYAFWLECPVATITDCYPLVNDPGVVPLSVTLQPKYAAAAAFDYTTTAKAGALKITVHNSEASI